MILKEKELSNAISPQALAGQKQEKDVAFFLRREFKDHPRVMVLNDFSFSHNSENAQIDHLIIYPFGFVLIESKSIKGEVRVNNNGEWSRSMGNRWSGMPSPIKQVELQQKLLHEYLNEFRSDILPKLLGVKEQTFGRRCWHNICAVSSTSIIERDSMPDNLSEQIVKSEFIADKVKEVMNLKNKLVNALTFDSRPEFTDGELQSITKFLLESPADVKTEKEEPPHVDKKIEEDKSTLLSCKKCGESIALTPLYGRYGYFVNCIKCDTNTSMKFSCPKCQSKKTKVSKRKESYIFSCLDCNQSIQII